VSRAATSGAKPSDRDARAVLTRHGVHPKKHFGQNFLLDRHLSERIATLCAPEGAFVIEIGAGLGALTFPLLERARAVVAIERDRDLVPALTGELAEHPLGGKARVVEADAKRFDYAAELVAQAPPRAVVGNLPYNLTGPLLERIAGLRAVIERAGMLVQLEVAERITAAPGTSEYGALSVFLQAAFRVSKPLVVRRGAFFPQPNVDSAVVVLEPSPEPLEETDWLRKLVKAAFSQRRKQLRNAWSRVLPAPLLLDVAGRAGIDLERRGETLSVAEFGRVASEAARG
jgi:16S rRNA (adenine1518-N6/adenine1519-N6)-dimethyltransferase